MPILDLSPLCPPEGREFARMTAAQIQYSYRPVTGFATHGSMRLSARTDGARYLRFTTADIIRSTVPNELAAYLSRQL